MNNANINLGVVGCGYWGPNLIRNFVESPNARVLAVADLDPDRLDYVQRRFPGTITTADYTSLLTMGLDAIVIATPPATHFQIAKEALQSGHHVMVEKPMTLSSKTAEELLHLAAYHDRTLMVGHTFEYNPAIGYLKQIMQRGELGDIYYIHGVRANLGLFQPDLNVIWDLAPHDVSILHYLLDMTTTCVSVQASSHVLDGIHDVAYLHLGFPDGISAHLHLSWLDPCKVRRITVVGNRKMAVYDDVEPLEKIRIYDKGVSSPPFTDTFEGFHLSYRHGDVTIPHIALDEPLRLECEHFLESIANKTVPQSSGEVGLMVVKVVEAAAQALTTGKTQEIPARRGLRVHEPVRV